MLICYFLACLHVMKKQKTRRLHLQLLRVIGKQIGGRAKVLPPAKPPDHHLFRIDVNASDVSVHIKCVSGFFIVDPAPLAVVFSVVLEIAE